MRYEYEKELAELKNRPPPITPRNQPSNNQLSRSPSPQKQDNKYQKQQEQDTNKQHSKIQQQTLSQQPPPTGPSFFNEDIYLPEYCPLTLRAVQKNPNTLKKFREAAIKEFNEELDSIGITPVNDLIIILLI